MSIGKQEELQGTLWLSYDQLPKSMGHAFYDHLQRILLKGQFDSFAEKICEPYYAKGKGRPSVPPGRYFRMLLVGYFECIDSERDICWRCADSLSLREFLRLDIKQVVPDHSSLSRIRSRLPLEAHQDIFLFVLKLLAEANSPLKNWLQSRRESAIGNFVSKESKISKGLAKPRFRQTSLEKAASDFSNGQLCGNLCLLEGYTFRQDGPRHSRQLFRQSHNGFAFTPPVQQFSTPCMGNPAVAKGDRS